MRLLLLSIFSPCLFACSNGGTASDASSDAPIAQDSTATDANGNDAASDAGSDASTGCGAYAYCDDFESYEGGAIANNATLGPWKATITGMGVKFAVDEIKPYGGSKSLHVSVPSNAGEDAGTAARGSLNQAAAAGLVAGNNVYGRAMVFYSNANGNDLPLGVHSWLFNSAGDSAIADGGVNMNMGGGGAKMQLNYHPPAPLTEQSVQGGAITAGAWHCVQWEYDGSGAPPNDVGKVWVDGTLAVNVMKTEGWNFATPWNTFDFGFTHYEILANSVDVYLDDFALDGAMVPCPP